MTYILFVSLSPLYGSSFILHFFLTFFFLFISLSLFRGNGLSRYREDAESRVVTNHSRLFLWLVTHLPEAAMSRARMIE